MLTDFYQVPAAQLLYCPFLLDDVTVQWGFEFAQRQHLSFIGNFRHEPNWQAVLRLKRLWPELRRQLPGVELHIYGCLLYTSPSPRDGLLSRMPSSA